MNLTSDQIRKVVGKSANQEIIDGVISSMREHALEFELDRPERVVHFLAQIAHESAHFRTTTEFASGAAYEGRKYLGNTFRGDGRKYRGRGLIQLTGRSNTKAFSQWMRRRDFGCPDFEANPEIIADFPWAFLASIYYWSSRDLNKLADANNIELITRRINGGLNGYADRLQYYDGFALAYLGYQIGSSGIWQFQFDKSLKTDGVSGPQTRDAFHSALKALPTPSLPLAEISAEPPPKLPSNAPPGAYQPIWIYLTALIGRFFYRR